MSGIIDILSAGIGATGAITPAPVPVAESKSLAIVGATGIVTLDNTDPLTKQRIIVIRSTAAAAAAESPGKDLWQDDEEQHLRDRRRAMNETPRPSRPQRRDSQIDRSYAVSANNRGVQLNTLLLQHELNGMSISDIKATNTRILGQVINTDKQAIGLVISNGGVNNYISTKKQAMDSTLPIMGIINNTQSKDITTVKSTGIPKTRDSSSWFKIL
jgi:hypothetical protein